MKDPVVTALRASIVAMEMVINSDASDHAANRFLLVDTVKTAREALETEPTKRDMKLLKKIMRRG